MKCLSLEVTPVLGMDIAECCASAARIAADVGLHHVTFTANGEDWKVFPDFTGFAMKDGRTVATYEGGLGGGVTWVGGEGKL